MSGKRDRSAPKGRLTPSSSDFPGISAQLEGLSEDRMSSDFGYQSKLSSGLGATAGKNLDYEGSKLPAHKIKEIRTFVAHEIYRV